MSKITLQQLCEVAFAHEEGDPMDWGVFTNGKDQAMGMIGASIWKHRLEAGYSIDYTTVNLPVKALLTHEVFCRFNLLNFTFKTVNAPVKTPRFRLN